MRRINLNRAISSLKRLEELVEARNSLNLNDLNIDCEVIYRQLLNVLFGWNLENSNITIKFNCPGFDLVDKYKKILIQVSSDVSKDKISKSLDKKIYKDYNDYSFKFLGITEKVDSKMKNIEFSNPYNLKFNPQEDIIDHQYLISLIQDASIEKQEKITSILWDEIKSLLLLDIKQVTTNLAQLINIIHETDLI
ncbi:SMEK domain-containing protein, partial [Mycoplasma yeatsii]|uniref:SMEK domain-containing protein n=1 Tax=Mycoplasma yeatsii TaxID=51365 RepID=UPI000567EE0D